MAPNLQRALGALLLVSSLPISEASYIAKRGLVVPSTLPGTWVSQGCYVDVPGRTLTQGGYSDNAAMTDESCIAYCSKAGNIYAGTEYSSQCYCGNSLAAGSGPAATTDCSMACTGNATEACGGPNRLNLFWSGTSGPQTNPGAGNWSFVGCYAEGTTGRALPNGVTTTGGSGAMTVDLCTSACQAAGYLLAGAEYAGECWCGNAIANGGALAPDGLAGCNMLCNGNLSEYCGGPSRLDVYDYNHAVSLPPWTTTSSTSSSTKTSTSSSTSSTSSSTKSSTSSSTSSTSSSTKTSTSSSTTSTSSSTKSSTSSSTSSTSSSTKSSTSSSTSLTSTSTSSSSSTTSSTSSSSSSSKSVTSTSSSSATASPTLGIKPIIGPYAFQGCYTEGTNIRALTGAVFYNYTGMTLEQCEGECAAYKYWGVEYGGECYCGNSLNTGSVLAANQGDCNFICPGNSYEYCGAGNRLEMYLLNGVASSTTSTVSSTSSSSSSLSSSTKSSSTSTVSSSSSSSSSSSTKSSSTSTVSSSSSSSSSSSTKSSSSSSTTSSSSVSSSVQVTTSTSSSATSAPTLGIKPTVGAYAFQGCYTEGTNTRALTGAAFYSYGAMTLEMCATDCAGFTFWGVEYGGECYCGNSLSTGSVLAASQSDCSFICPGNSYEYCGAGNRLEMYKLNGTVSNPTTSSTTSSSTSSTSVSISTPTTTGLPAGWSYQGCWVDGANGRILNDQLADNQALTIESCVNSCAAAGFTIAGAEWSVQCFCGNAIYNGGALAATQTDCNMPCGGNSAEICGAGGRLSLYSIGTPQIFQPPGPQKTGLPANWVYSGCLQDNILSSNGNPQVAVQTFPYKVWDDSTNTPVACIEQCQLFGFNAAGLEYGSQCFCGDVENILVASAPSATTDPTQVQFYIRSATPQVLPDSKCTALCTGNNNYICGDNNMLTYYTWAGPAPLYNWAFPQGNSAGSYSLLIGGVVVPLMTSQVITGKVTFLEKSAGTGEPNGTGAYELDLSEINNFSAAWRTMSGLQTDVFCSAGLTLPDKAGRQLTVAGWAGDSNYGIRLYWPDGSAGVPGVNEWVEDPSQLMLQVPRWYPSAMIMANGSILVVGGEIGSNDAEQPTLEILPATGVPDASTTSGYSNTTVYLDFLQRTAPFNLYPFICVVPSGVFIAYYNEARILDEVTFETVKVLPNMPGAVNDPTGGRNYQLEGAMVIMPQYPPYNAADLTILICGGSTSGGGFPIDNCVSTQPEAASPQWTIERMPSRRVMPCIAGLPDGTYIILNGAQHGVAGFGLGGVPNYNAVLYDPTKPVNSRMSIMANTTVARLYHSEAIVLLDGRVLVSGSDPTGDYVNPPANEWPEEYRVEVFTPPYLLSGLARPTFTITNTDWSYGQSVTFTVTSGSASAVSLLGSVVSTHGNSMGQRTLFPAVSCAGATCTVVAPPNAHVCPPGWYMMFVLNGPTPSVGQFVRIGGDPAALGNWPNLPGFQLPGV